MDSRVVAVLDGMNRRLDRFKSNNACAARHADYLREALLVALRSMRRHDPELHEEAIMLLEAELQGSVVVLGEIFEAQETLREGVHRPMGHGYWQRFDRLISKLRASPNAGVTPLDIHSVFEAPDYDRNLFPYSLIGVETP